MRLGLLVVSLMPAALAQYAGFAMHADGSRVFLATSYRQPGAGQTTDPKVFRMEQGRVDLLRTQVCDPIRMTGACGVEDLQASGTGAVVYQSRIPCMGGSSCFLRETSLSRLLLPGGEVREFAGRIRISRSGRYLVNHDLSGAPGESSRVSRRIDLETGATAELGADLRRFGNAVAVADDGAVLMDRGWLVRPDGRAQLVLPDGAAAVDMDAAGTVVLAGIAQASLFAEDVRGGVLRQIGPSDRANYGGTLSDDGKWVLYVSVIGETPQLFFSSVDQRTWRQLTVDEIGVQRAQVSGDGRSALALLRNGALVRIDTSTGAQVELVGPLPYAVTVQAPLVAGSWNVLQGQALAGARVAADGPWPEELGGVRLTVGEVAMRLGTVSSGEIVFQVPWEAAGAAGPLVIHSGPEQVFEAAFAADVLRVSPRLLAVVHEDFGSLVTADRPAVPGEFVHLYMTGLGEVAPGALPRLANGWRFVWRGPSLEAIPAEVPFAGLAPGLTGIYQVDLRIPELARYELLFVDPEGGSSYAFSF